MPQVGFEPTIQVFERAKTIHALLERAPIVIRSLGSMLRHKSLLLSDAHFPVYLACSQDPDVLALHS
jgi:hypothetical protein